jgi:hypothetical protein
MSRKGSFKTRHGRIQPPPHQQRGKISIAHQNRRSFIPLKLSTLGTLPPTDQEAELMIPQVWFIESTFQRIHGSDTPTF